MMSSSERPRAKPEVRLRGVEEDDLQRRVDWINDPAIQATLNYDVPVTLARTRDWFAAARANPTRRDMSVVAYPEEAYIGFGGFLGIDWRTRSAEMYAVIGNRQYWKGGYGTALYQELMRFGFMELGLNRIWGTQLPDNIAAHRVVEKLGWTREGLLRESRWSHGRIRDQYVVAILRNDWEKQ